MSLSIDYISIDMENAITDLNAPNQAPYPFPAVPPNGEFAGLNTGLPTYYEGLLGRYFVLLANYKFNPF